jgi:hypothetical protein
MIKETRIIDDLTGEVKHTTTKRFPARFDEAKGYLFWERKDFAKSFLDVPYPEEMTDAEIGRIAKLAKKMWSNTNMLGYRGKKGVVPYSVEQIGKEIGLGPRQARRFLAKMIKLGMIQTHPEGKGREKVVQYYINPMHFFSSNRIPLGLYLLFKEQLDKELPDWVKGEYKKAEEEQTSKGEGKT